MKSKRDFSRLVDAVEQLIGAADDLISAIEGTTDQFEPEVQALCAASAAEKTLSRIGGAS